MNPDSKRVGNYNGILSVEERLGSASADMMECDSAGIKGIFG